MCVRDGEGGEGLITGEKPGAKSQFHYLYTVTSPTSAFNLFLFLIIMP